ncbi:MAG: peptide deformylase [Gemmatimonadetes bacterium]|nr:peptide deformylase [Gemmatimonadota bacterium]NNK49627.1 peptide deformylase [Gemmatimonadota bacterium]
MTRVSRSSGPRSDARPATRRPTAEIGCGPGEETADVSVRDVRYLGDPVLREKCQEVEAFDTDVRALVGDLLETMYAEDGIGLAAPQIGVPLRVFVYDVRDDEIEPGVLVNPRIVEATGKQKEVEGCLSIPGLDEVVERSGHVVVEGLDGAGEPVRVEAEGLLSRCLQHECDHLDGVLFIDRVSPLKRRMLLKKWSKMDESVR